jgi:hypothetical protein
LDDQDLREPVNLQLVVSSMCHVAFSSSETTFAAASIGLCSQNDFTLINVSELCDPPSRSQGERNDDRQLEFMHALVDMARILDDDARYQPFVPC